MSGDQLNENINNANSDNIETEIDNLSNEVSPFLNLETEIEKDNAVQYVIDGLSAADAVHGFVFDKLANRFVNDYLKQSTEGAFADTVGDGVKGMLIKSFFNNPKKLTIHGVEFASIAEYLEIARIAINDPNIQNLKTAKESALDYASTGDPEEGQDEHDANTPIIPPVDGDNEYIEELNESGFSNEYIDNLTASFPYKKRNCSGNVRMGLDNLHAAGLTDMFIPQLPRAEMHGTLVRKTMGIEDLQKGEKKIAKNFKGYLDGLDFSQKNNDNGDTIDRFDSAKQYSQIKNMKGNSMVLVFTNRYPVEKRGYGYPGHASVAFRGSDGEIYVHDESFSAGAIRKHIFKLEPYLRKLVGGYNTHGGARRAYHLDAAMSGNISVPNNNSDNDIIA